jgi:hypothetical protein
MTFDGCCTELGGQVEGIFCKDVSLLGRPYNVDQPCEYLEAGREARASFPFGGLAYDVGLFFGSLSAFLIPSTSRYTPANPESAPLASTYTDVAKQTAEYGLVVFAVVGVVGFYVTRKLLK